MNNKKLFFLFNPTSGRGLIRGYLMTILNIFVKAGYEVTVHPTQGRDDALNLIPQVTDRFDLLVCCGGDGTLYETVTGMMNAPVKIPIGYIPAGSTNDFAASLGIPKNLPDAATVAVTGRQFHCDVGMFNNNYFVYVAAFGAFTDVSYQTHQILKNVLGHAAYVVESSRHLKDLSQSYHLTVKANGKVIEDDFVYGMITNSVSVGGMKNLTGTQVELDDGLFEVTLIRALKNPLMLPEILANLMRPVDNSQSVNMYSFVTDHLEIISEEAVPWTLDGEYGGEHTSVVLDNCHKEITFIVGKKGERDE